MSTQEHTTPPVPRWARRIMARAQARDRAHFERHPYAWFYWRPALPGEFAPESVPAGAPVFVLRSPSPLVRIRRCGDVVAIDLEERATEIGALLGPPAGCVVVDILRSDVGDPDGGQL